MSRRFFDDQPFTANQSVTLSPGPSHHIAKVLRMGAQEPVTLFNGRGGEWSAVVEEVGKKAVVARLLVFHDIDRMPPRPVVLGLPLIKGERMDYAIQKATEMGVAAIQVLETERTEVRLKAEREDRKIEHWRQVVTAACEQCGMNRLPRLEAVMPLRDFLVVADGLKLIAHPGEAALSSQSLRAASPASSPITLLTGPEGGFSAAELDAANAAGFRSFALGERVLRAETAPVALLGALWALLSESCV